MKDKKNCWEIKKCGKEPGGKKVNELGACLAATEKNTDGINNGKNSGRCCWAVAGTLCGEKIQGIFAKKMLDCIKCEVYQLVQEEEGENFSFLNEALQKLGKEHLSPKNKNKKLNNL